MTYSITNNNLKQVHKQIITLREENGQQKEEINRLKK